MTMLRASKAARLPDMKDQSGILLEFQIRDRQIETDDLVRMSQWIQQEALRKMRLRRSEIQSPAGTVEISYDDQDR